MGAIPLTSLPSFADLPGQPSSCLVQQAFAVAVQNAPQDSVFCSGDLIGYEGPGLPPLSVTWSPVEQQFYYPIGNYTVQIPTTPPIRYSKTPEPNMLAIMLISVCILAIRRIA